jgi:hypothetical protein
LSLFKRFAECGSEVKKYGFIEVEESQFNEIHTFSHDVLRLVCIQLQCRTNYSGNRLMHLIETNLTKLNDRIHLFFSQSCSSTNSGLVKHFATRDVKLEAGTAR